MEKEKGIDCCAGEQDGGHNETQCEGKGRECK